MELEKINLFGKKVWPIGIPSGTVTTDPRCARRLMDMVEEIGIWTSKSYTRNERVVPGGEEVDNLVMGRDCGFREPILEAIGFGSFVNAVGLINPGCKRGRQDIIDADIPKDRVVIGSSAGNSPEDFVYIVKTLDDAVDAHEMNVSCPHAEGMGIVIGSNPQLVYDYVSPVVKVANKPVIVKLPPVNNIGEVAKVAISAGAFGLSGINTVPGYSEVLTSGNCGISGRAIFRRALRCVKDMREAVGDEVFIQGMGGINTARDAEMCFKFVNAIAIGSAFAGMTEGDIGCYAPRFVSDLESGDNNASRFLRTVDMNYRRTKVEEILNSDCDFKIFRTNERIDTEPGQFVFVYLPGVGEKPFSVMDDDPLTLGIRERGRFTNEFSKLKKGDEFYVRGPYGQGIQENIVKGQRVSLVGGGCGIAGLYLLAKKFDKSQIRTFLGAKDKGHLPYLDKFRECGEVFVATEDGSLGEQGFVTDLFNRNEFYNTQVFFNCGPRAMVDAVLPLELKVSGPEKIYSSVDYMTRCGVGICGSCCDEYGRRTCVEGPFMKQRV